MNRNTEEIMNYIGKRVECDKTRGTIKWQGKIDGTEGIWYGVDWDTSKKGKHNGTHNGIKYFPTSTAKSGSFVRLEKLHLGINIEEAVRGRYQNDTTIPEDVTKALQRTFNARFVEVVGMEKIGKKQSDLSSLRVVALDGWNVRCGIENLQILLPSLRDLDLSNTLIPSWEELSGIIVQLPELRFLNVSGNRLKIPSEPQTFVKSFCHVTHLILNHMPTYTWNDLLVCFSLFPNMIRVQLSHNNLVTLGPIPQEVMQTVEDVDLGVNSISDWTEICNLGYLPRLKTLNINSNKFQLVSFPGTEIGSKTCLFPNLKALMMASNPLRAWETIGELNKLQNLTDLILTLDKTNKDYFLEFAFARILNLQMLNRTRISLQERKDYQIFYMRHFSSEYYSNGGTESLKKTDLTKEFLDKHPTYLTLVKEFGAPADDRLQKSNKNQKLRDLKLNLSICFPDDSNISEFSKSVLPSTKLSKLKMMIRRSANLSLAVKMSLWYVYLKDGSEYEIYLDNDLQDLSYYSVSNGDKIVVRYS